MINVLVSAAGRMTAAALFAGRAGEAGLYAGLGIAIVFLVLAFIWGVLEIVHLFFGVDGLLAKRKNRKNATGADGRGPGQSADGDADVEMNEEEIAAVTAAVALLLEEERRSSGRPDEGQPAFRVVNFRRSDRFVR